MADEVTVAITLKDGVNEIKDLEQKVDGVIEKMDSATEAQNASAASQDAAAESMKDAAEAVKSSGAHMGDNGSPNGANHDLFDNVTSNDGGGFGGRGGSWESSELVEKLSDAAKKRGIDLGEFGDSIRGLGGKLGKFSEVIGEGGAGGRGVLGSLGGLSEGAAGAGEALSGLGEAVAPLVAAVGGTLAFIGAIDEGVEKYQALRDVSISQTGDDSNITLGPQEWFDVYRRDVNSGISEEESKKIQESLIASRSAFGSSDYEEGFSFAQTARTEYTMNVTDATTMWTRAVKNGSATTQELTDTLENLSRQAKETGTTQTEQIDSMIKSMKALESSYGEVGAAQVSMALANMDLDPEQRTSLAGRMATIRQQSGYGSVYNSLGQQFMDEKGMSSENAAAAASAMMTIKGYNASNKERDMLTRNLSGGMNLSELMLQASETGDSTAIEQALTRYRDERGFEYENDFISTLVNSGMISEHAGSDPKKVARDLERYSRVLSGKKDETSEEDKQARVDTLKGKVDYKNAGAGGRAAYNLKQQDWFKNLPGSDFIADWLVDPIGDVSSLLSFEVGPSMENASMENELNEKFSRGDVSQLDAESLDWGLADLINAGLATSENFYNVSDDDRRSMMEQIVEEYQQSGESSWKGYIDKYGESKIKDEISSWTGSSGETGKEGESGGQKIKGEIKVGFEGPLGEFLHVTQQNFEWFTGKDKGND